MTGSRPRDISPAQLVMLLLLCRLFVLFTDTSRSENNLSGPASLASVPLAAAGALLMLLPFFLLRRKAGGDMLTAFWRVGRPFGAALTAACGLFCVYTAASTAGHFSFFLVSTVYQNAKQWVFVLLFLLAAAYAAALGLEAFSRAGGFFFAAAMAAGALLLFALLPEVDLANLASPFLDPGALAAGTLRGVAGNADFLLFLLLFPRVRGGSGKTGFWWVALTAAVWWVLCFFVLTALGDYAGTRLFPLQTAAAVANLSVFGRMDLVHITVWIITAFLRAAAWLYCGCTCLRRLFPKVRMGAASALCALAAGIAAVAAAPLWEAAGSAWESGVPLLLLAVAAPLVTLCFPRAKSPVEDGKEAAQ